MWISSKLSEGQADVLASASGDSEDNCFLTLAQPDNVMLASDIAGWRLDLQVNATNIYMASEVK